MKPKLIVAVLVVLGIALAIAFMAGIATAFIAGQPDALAQQSKAHKWEHKVMELDPDSGLRQVATVLDTLANDGWEFVGLVATGGAKADNANHASGYVAFKRLKK